MKNKKSGFTLAEILVTLTLLGVVAAITIPSSLKNTEQRANKTKIRKAMATYEKLIENIVIENNLTRNEQVLNDFVNNGGNCENIQKYIKFNETADGNNCQFRANDGLWWDVSEITNTIISFKEENLNAASADGTEYTAFRLVTRYDTQRNYRINDMGYLTNSDYAISVIKNNASIFAAGEDGEGHQMYSSSNSATTMTAINDATKAILGVQKINAYLENNISYKFKKFPDYKSRNVEFLKNDEIVLSRDYDEDKLIESFEDCDDSYYYCGYIGFKPDDGSTWYGGSGCYLLGNVAYCLGGQTSRWNQTKPFGDNETIIEMKNNDGTSTIWHRFDLWQDHYSNLEQPAPSGE